MVSSDVLDFKILYGHSEKLFDLAIDPRRNKELGETLGIAIEVIAGLAKHASSSQITLQTLQKEMEIMQGKVQAPNAQVDCFHEIRSMNARINALGQGRLSAQSPHAGAAVPMATRPVSPVMLSFDKTAQEYDRGASQDGSRAGTPCPPPFPNSSQLDSDSDADGSGRSTPCTSPPPEESRHIIELLREAGYEPFDTSFAAAGHGVAAAVVSPHPPGHGGASAAAAAGPSPPPPVQATRRLPIVDAIGKQHDAISHALTLFSMALPAHVASQEEIKALSELWKAFLKKQYTAIISWVVDDDHKTGTEAQVKTKEAAAVPTPSAHAKAAELLPGASAAPQTVPFLELRKQELDRIQGMVDTFKTLADQLPKELIDDIGGPLLVTLQRIMASEDDIVDTSSVGDDVPVPVMLKHFNDCEYHACLVGVSNLDMNLIDTFINNVIVQRLEEMGMPAFMPARKEKVDGGEQMVLLDEIDRMMADCKKITPASFNKFIESLQKREGVIKGLCEELLLLYNGYFQILEEKPKGVSILRHTDRAHIVQQSEDIANRIGKLKQELTKDQGPIALKYTKWTSPEQAWDQIDYSYKVLPAIPPAPLPNVHSYPLDAPTEKLVAELEAKLDAQLNKIRSHFAAFIKEALLLPEAVSQLIYLNIALDITNQAVIAIDD